MEMWNRKPSYAALLIILAVILILSLLLSVSVGVAGGGGDMLLGILDHSEESALTGEIILKMRMPRALAACLTGAAFALAGAVMQGVTHNPLADSGLLGINAGAGFLVVLSSIIWPSPSSFGTMASAFCGAALAACMVYGLGTGKGKQGPLQLILAGSAVSALLTALSQGAALNFGLSKDLSFWSSGNLSGISWPQLVMAAPWIIAAALLAMVLSDKLSILALGEENASGLGLNIRAVQMGGLFAVLVLAGVSVSLAGGVSFLGLMIPHVARFLVGAGYRRIIPVSAFLGGILLVLSDVAARMIHAPFDTPVGALVSLLGVPFFLLMTYKRKGGGGV